MHLRTKACPVGTKAKCKVKDKVLNVLTDRYVHELGSKPLIGDGTNPFSSYQAFHNIVLLGDPGAGKTHLFNEFAQLKLGEFLSARSFLNVAGKHPE